MIPPTGSTRWSCWPSPTSPTAWSRCSRVEADAATGDDTVLAGLAAQDPNTEVVGEKFTEEPYGLGMAKDSVDFVRFVNSVIEEMRTDGRWQDIYSKWLVGVLSDTVIDPPPAVYGREP